MATNVSCCFSCVESVYLFIQIFLYVCGRVVNMCDSTIHLGHFISSTNKKSTVKSAKSCFWRSFDIVISDLGQLSCSVKCQTI